MGLQEDLRNSCPHVSGVCSDCAAKVIAEQAAEIEAWKDASGLPQDGDRDVVPADSAEFWAGVVKRCDEQAAKIARLEKDVRGAADTITQATIMQTGYKDTITKQAAEIARLRAALEYIADCSQYDVHTGQNRIVQETARAALGRGE